MRTLQKNKQKMKYSLFGYEIPIYEEEDYIDSEGNRIPIDTGTSKIWYHEPVNFEGSISFSGGESEASEFGLNLADYSAVLVVGKGVLPINETSLIWLESEPAYKKDGTLDKTSADFTVVKGSPTLNVDRFVLKRVVK